MRIAQRVSEMFKTFKKPSVRKQEASATAENNLTSINKCVSRKCMSNLINAADDVKSEVTAKYDDIPTKDIVSFIATKLKQYFG